MQTVTSLQQVSRDAVHMIPQGFTLVNDKEFNSYGHVAEVYKRESALGGRAGDIAEEILISPLADIPPKKILIGEIPTTNYYYEPTTPGDKERIRIARLLLCGYTTGGPPPMLELGASAFSIPHPLHFTEGVCERGVLIGDVEVLSGNFKGVLFVKSIDDHGDPGDVTEIVNLNFFGCPSIEMGVDKMGTTLVTMGLGVSEALTVLFGRPVFLIH